MAFYQQDPEMANCLKGLLDRFEKEGRPNLQENIAITCIRYDKQNPSASNDMGQDGIQIKIIRKVCRY